MRHEAEPFASVSVPSRFEAIRAPRQQMVVAAIATKTRKICMPTQKKNSSSDVLENPASHFDSPSQILTANRLSDEQKKQALDAWEEDARRLSVATEEGMSGGESSRMDEVSEAKVELGIKDERKPAPTKAG
jgi:hypothetical protein